MVEEDRLCEDERADEEEHQRISERREHLPRRRNAHDHRHRRAEERRHRHRQRLGNPEHDDRREDRREPVRLGLESRHRQQEQRDEHGGSEKHPGPAAHALEADLSRAEDLDWNDGVGDHRRQGY
jgi:hypothetical protein